METAEMVMFVLKVLKLQQEQVFAQLTHSVWQVQYTVVQRELITHHKDSQEQLNAFNVLQEVFVAM